MSASIKSKPLHKFHTRLYVHTHQVTHVSPFVSACPPLFFMLHPGDIFKQTISPAQCVGSGIWIFIAHWRRCRRFNLDYGVISTHTDSGRDLETADLLSASLDTQLSWTQIINVCLIKVVAFKDRAELCKFLTRFAFIVPFSSSSLTRACLINRPKSNLSSSL